MHDNLVAAGLQHTDKFHLGFQCVPLGKAQLMLRHLACHYQLETRFEARLARQLTYQDQQLAAAELLESKCWSSFDQ
jgi:hypothetical protein